MLQDAPLMLMVEDDPADARLLQVAFEDAELRAQLVYAGGGQEALWYFQQLGPSSAIPQLVLLDWLMPCVDGQGVLAWLKTHPRFCHVPVVVLSGSEDQAHRERALAGGAAEVVEKPFGTADLVVTLKRLHAKYLADGAFRSGLRCPPRAIPEEVRRLFYRS